MGSFLTDKREFKVKEKTMAIGGGPTPDQWKKMSRSEKISYVLFLAFVFGVILYFAYEKWIA